MQVPDSLQNHLYCSMPVSHDKQLVEEGPKQVRQEFSQQERRNGEMHSFKSQAQLKEKYLAWPTAVPIEIPLLFLENFTEERMFDAAVALFLIEGIKTVPASTVINLG